MKNFFNIKAFALVVFALFAMNFANAQDDANSGLSNDDFLPISAVPSDTPISGGKNPSSKAGSYGRPNQNPDADAKDGSEDVGEDGKAPSIKPPSEGGEAPAGTSRSPKRPSRHVEDFDEKDYFDASYIRRAAFYELPFLDVEPSELSDYERDKLVATLKRRLSIYNATVKKIEAKIEAVGGEVVSSSRASYFSKKVNMPVIIDGKEYDAINGILVAFSKNSMATAFFANIKNRNFIVTNMHVMQSESDVNFRTFNGIEIKMPHVGFYSRGKDVFILPINSIPEGCIALPIEEDVSKNLSVYDKLVVCGNSMGGGTLVHRAGEVVAVGPEIVEHNCDVQKGHSGSPIYSRKSKKIVGVLSHGKIFTYFEKGQKLGKNPKENLRIGERDFGYRIDNIKDWSQIKTDKLIELSTSLKEFQDKYKYLSAAIRENLYSRTANYRELDKIINSFRTRNKGSAVAFKEAKLDFLNNVKNLIGHEIILIKNKKLDDVFTSAIYLIDALTELQNDCNSLIRTE